MNQLIFEQWVQTQLHGGRIAAWIGDHAGFFDRITVEFGQAIRRLTQNLWASVRDFIPLLKRRHISNPKIRRQVDDFDIVLEQLGRLRHRHAVRCGKKHHIAGIEQTIFWVRKAHVHHAAQIRKHLRHRHTRFGARSNRNQFYIRMQAEDAQQFHARVACTADNADFNFLCHLFFLFLRNGFGACVPRFTTCRATEIPTVGSAYPTSLESHDHNIRA